MKRRKKRRRSTPLQRRKPLLKQLEDRCMLSISAALAGNDITFQGDTSADTIEFSVDASGQLTHNLGGTGGFADNNDLDSSTAGSQSRNVNTIDSLSYQDTGKDDSVFFLGSNDFDFNGGSLTVNSGSIDVAAGRIISTRQISGSDLLNDDSSGDSGDISFTAHTITVNTGAMLLAHASGSGGHDAGDVSISASDTDATGVEWLDFLLDELIAPVFGTNGVYVNQASIDLSGATIKGGNVNVESLATFDADPWLSQEIFDGFNFGNLIQVGEVLVFGEELTTLPLGVLGRVTDSSVKIDGGSVIDASGDVTIGTTAESDGSVKVRHKLFSVGFGLAFATAETMIGGTSQIAAAGDIAITSDATGTANVDTKSVTEEDGVVSLAISVTDVTANTDVGQNVTITSGANVAIQSTGNNTASGVAEFGAEEDAKAGLTVAFTWAQSDIDTTVDGRVTATGASVVDTIDLSQVSGTAITLPNHRYTTGDRVTYRSTGNPPIMGLEDEQVYYVRVLDANRIQLTKDLPIDIDNSLTSSDARHTISETTLTKFNPALTSDSGNVNTSDDTIAITGHGFVTGQEVIYSSLSGEIIEGLVEGKSYYVIRNDANTIRLADSLTNAFAATPVAVDITAAGTGTDHALVVRNTQSFQTFDSSSTADATPGAVNLTADTLSITGHGYVTGDRVKYSTLADNDDTGKVGGLTEGASYYVIRVDNDTLKLADDYADATAGTAIDLTAAGAGGTHLLIKNTSATFFDPSSTSVVGSDANTFTITGHGFSTGDVVSYNFDPARTRTRDLAKSFSIDPGEAFVDTEDSNNIVDSAGDRIKLAGHGFTGGETVTYEVGRGLGGDDSPIGGLTDGTSYTVVRVDDNFIQLKVNPGDASAIDLDAATATGSLHFLRFNRTGLEFDDAVITGLEDGRAYYVAVLDANTFLLAESLQQAQNAAPISLDATGITGTHTLDDGTTAGISITSTLNTSESMSAKAGIGGDGGLNGLLGDGTAALMKKGAGKLRKSIMDQLTEKTPEAESGADTSKFSLAGAVSFINTDHDVHATVGSNAVLKTTRDIDVTATQTDTIQN
ncbi:MAG: hypothetical protein MI725_01115, partial [Pirellulales bacterium]|nr:hypothetical protein [Pirellulales bacterium]